MFSPTPVVLCGGLGYLRKVGTLINALCFLLLHCAYGASMLIVYFVEVLYHKNEPVMYLNKYFQKQLHFASYATDNWKVLFY